MPTRYLKPGIRDSEPIDQVSALAETLFYRLLVTVDDFGRFDARPAMVKSHCFPIKESVTAKHCAAALHELVQAGLLHLYEVDGKPVLQLCKWDNAPRAKESKYPPMPAVVEGPRTTVCIASTVLPGTGTGTGTENRKPERKPRTETATVSPAAAVAPTADVWRAYSGAYADRYGAEPVSNATVNGQLAQFVKRLGADEAPAVARFYVGHQGRYYVQQMHGIGPMLKDAEKLRTEWATGKQMTHAGAVMADKTQTNLNAFGQMIADAKAQEAQDAQRSVA